MTKIVERRDRSGLSLQSYCGKAFLNKPIVEHPCGHHTELLDKISSLSNGSQETLKHLADQGFLTKDEIEALSHFLFHKALPDIKRHDAIQIIVNSTRSCAGHRTVSQSTGAFA